MLLRNRLPRSQSVACADVQAGVLKALPGLAPTKETCPCFKTRKTHARGDTCTSRERSHPRVPLERERLQGPSMPASLEVPFEFDRSFVFWPRGPCFATEKREEVKMREDETNREK